MERKYLIITVGSDAVFGIKNERNKRIYVTINSIAFIYNQITERYKRIIEILTEYDEHDGKKKHNEVKIDFAVPRRNELIGLTWDFIDWSSRLRKVLSASAGVKKKDQWYKLMISALESVDDIRNFIQHYDREISKLLVGTYPIKGTVFAFFKNGDRIYSRVILSTPARFSADRNITIAGFFFPTSIKDKISNIHFTIGNLFIDLSKVYAEISSSKEKLASYLKSIYKFNWPSE